MFRETTANTQMSLFDNPADLMGKRAVKKYEDPKAWFNQFYELVTSQIDESVFKPLFKEGNMGAPTASIRQLVAMNILKEGFGCSDEDLIEKCDYDLLTRRALGLIRLEDEAPSLDTYYLLRRRICDYADATGENLMETCFSRLTKFQAAKFKISGKSVRMDSKLIGSNIAWYPRYELVHKTFLQEIGQYMSRLNPSLRKKVQPWLEENAKQTVYRSNSETIQQRLAELGRIIYAVLVRVKAKDGLLKQVFEEQYIVEHGQVTPRDKKAIAAGSVQNPNDPEAEYRQKGQQKVKGYSVNITETTDQADAPSLITGVQVEGATAADNAFYEEAIAKSEATTGSAVETVYSDGAYQNADNRALSVNGVFTGIQGRQSRYLLDESDGDTVRITDTRTGEVHEAKRTRSGALRIPYPGDRSKYKWRYFLPKQLESMRSRKQMEDIPQEEKNKRNNVEASIFQLCFHTRNNKTRYRGKRKHELWAFARSAWINLRRILLFQGKNAPEGITGAHNGTLSPLMALLNAMSQTCVHLKLYFSGPGFRPAAVAAGLKY